MKLKNIIGLLLFVSLLFSLACNGVDYAKIMQKKVKGVLGGDFKGYEWFSYPTNNFGLISCYSLANLNDKPSHENYVCGMWSCLNIPIEDIPTDEGEILSMNGFADYGGNGGEIRFSESEKKEITLKTVLPEIKQVLKLSAGLDWSKGVKTELTIGRVYPRRLNRLKMMEFINTLDAGNLIKKAFDEGRLAMIVGDVIVNSLRVTITVDKNINAKLFLELDGVVGKVLGKDSSLECGVSSSLSGTYQLSINKPVIVAALSKIQPSAGVLENEDPYDWEAWKLTSLSDEILKK